MATPAVTLKRDHQTFSKVVQYVHAHHGRNISVDEIAAHAGMSRATFNRFFRRVMDSTPTAYRKNNAGNAGG